MEGNILSHSMISVKNLQQKDNYTFTIEWSDGHFSCYRLSHLQQLCPCANCNNEITGERRVDAKSLDDNVRAHQIVSIGRYALKISFTSGCSNGIYGFDMLRRISKQSDM